MMSSVVLSSLLRPARPVKLPTLVRSYDYTSGRIGSRRVRSLDTVVLPSDVINPRPRPSCVRYLKRRFATLREEAAGTLARCRIGVPPGATTCAFTSPRQAPRYEDPNATVDVWTTGGLQFSNGAAYSYVVLVGTGSVREPWQHPCMHPRSLLPSRVC